MERFGIKLVMVQNGKPNAYLYRDKHLVASKSIFGKWFTTLKKLRELFPKNGLIKHLSSTLYGSLKVRNVTFKTPEEIDIEKIDVGLGAPHKYTMINDLIHDDGSEEVVIVETDNVFKSPLARIQPCITAFNRNKVAYFALFNGVENVVRVYIDNVCYTKPVDISRIPDIKLEKKSTGIMHFKNASTYVNFNDPNMITIEKHEELLTMYNNGKRTYKTDIKAMSKELKELL
jgi:hypothetical protein